MRDYKFLNSSNIHARTGNTPIVECALKSFESNFLCLFDYFKHVIDDKNCKYFRYIIIIITKCLQSIIM